MEALPRRRPCAALTRRQPGAPDGERAGRRGDVQHRPRRRCCTRDARGPPARATERSLDTRRTTRGRSARARRRSRSRYRELWLAATARVASTTASAGCATCAGPTPPASPTRVGRYLDRDARTAGTAASPHRRTFAPILNSCFKSASASHGSLPDSYPGTSPFPCALESAPRLGLIAQMCAQSGDETPVAPPRPSARAGRHPRHRVGRRVLLARLGSALGDRPSRHVRLLRVERVPHHGPAGRGTGVDRAGVPLEVLRPPGATAAARRWASSSWVAGRRAGHPGARAVDDHRARRRTGTRDVAAGRAEGRGRCGASTSRTGPRSGDGSLATFRSGTSGHSRWRSSSTCFGPRWSASVAGRRSRAAVGWAAALAALASFVDVALRWRSGHLARVDMSTDTRGGAFLVGAALAVAWTRRRVRGCGRPRDNRHLLAVGSPPRPGRGLLGLRPRRLALALHAGLGRRRRSRRVSCRRVPRRRRPTAAASWLRRSPRTSVVAPMACTSGTTCGSPGSRGMGLLVCPLALGASFVSAEVSWRLVERPALARKRRSAAVSVAQPVAEEGAPVLGCRGPACSGSTARRSAGGRRAQRLSGGFLPLPVTASSSSSAS